MNRNIAFLTLLLFVLSGCIEPYDVKTKTIDSILVVEGIITTGATQIILSKSANLDENVWNTVDNAEIYVECDDGVRTASVSSSGDGIYLIESDELNIDAKYRLCILVDGEFYQSSFLSPALSPPVDVSFTADDVFIDVCVTTHGYDGQPGYYLWSFNETWETHATLYIDSFTMLDGKKVINDLRSPINHYYCWARDGSKNLILGDTEKLINNTILEKKIHSFARSDFRTAVLYQIKVRQHTIHKEAYDFFTNLQKNIEETGSIFGPIPSEITGNIRCVSNPGIPVIGYVDVSTASADEQYLNNRYHIPFDGSEACKRDTLVWKRGPEDENFPAKYYGYVVFREIRDSTVFLHEVVIDDSTYVYREVMPNDTLILSFISHKCVDCIEKGGTKNKPEGWLNDHQ